MCHIKDMHCCRYAIFSSSISFWLPSIGIVYFCIQVTCKGKSDSVHRVDSFRHEIQNPLDSGHLQDQV